jgi:hypothetical protein
MLVFTDERLVTIQTIASPLPLQLRGAFLEALAARRSAMSSWRRVGRRSLATIALSIRRRSTDVRGSSACERGDASDADHHHP